MDELERYWKMKSAMEKKSRAKEVGKARMGGGRERGVKF